MKRLTRTHPELARLWSLAWDVTNGPFGSKDIFQNPNEEADLAQQREGERLIPELISGSYDAGLVAAAKGNVGTWKSPTFRELLEDYEGPISRAEARAGPIPRLIAAENYHFDHYETPRYPPLAMQARIEGIVELRLTVDPATGEVTDAAASGHKLLEGAAVAAVRKWRFAPESAGSGNVTATLEFSLRCPGGAALEPSINR